MHLIRKGLLLLTGFAVSTLAAGEGESATVGFRVEDYPVSAKVTRSFPPGKLALFKKEQQYNGCMPVGMGLGFYYASSFSMNQAEQAEIQTIYLRVNQEAFDESPQLRHVELKRGQLNREKVGQLEGNAGVSVHDSDVAKESQEAYAGSGEWYVYSVDPSKIKPFIEVYSSDLECNETLSRFEWESHDSVTEYSSRGYIQLYYEDGVLNVTGSVQRFVSFMGYALDEWGYKGTEINFNVYSLEGERYQKPRQQVQ